MDQNIDYSDEPDDVIIKLNKDLRKASETMGENEARFLVDSYYIHQNDRIRTAAQIREQEKTGEPFEVLQWAFDNSKLQENQIKNALHAWAKTKTVGRWMLEQKGIGPVISAGILANLDITKAPVAGHFWSFCGLNPNQKWDKGQKRPHNAFMKTLCAFKLGECFIKVQNRDNAFYGNHYKERKAKEVKRNDDGGNTQWCIENRGNLKDKKTLAYKFQYGCFPAGTTAKLQGMEVAVRDKFLKDIQLKEGEGLPMISPSHVSDRSRRWVVKLFLAHLHEIWYEDHYGKKSPAPYPIAMQGHAHKIEPPKSEAA